MKLSTKLYGSLGGLLFAGILLAAVGSWYLHELGNQLDEAANKMGPTVERVNGMRAKGWEMIATMRGVFVFSSLHDQQRLDKCAEEFLAARSAYSESIGQIRALITDEQSRQMLQTMEAALQEYAEPADEFMKYSKAGQFENVRPFVPRMFNFAETLNKTGTSFRDRQMELMRATSEHAASLKAQSMSVAVAMSCLLLVAGGLAVVTVRGANRTLSGVVADLSKGAHQVASAASQVASSSQTLAQGSSEQAASLEETSASTEEINSMARRNTDNSHQAAALVGSSQKKFIDANRSLDQMVTAMAEINAESDRISKIIKVIDEIAFQTNILALNAAVEAARAGESGMGFAVVADEVRSLAQRSAQAAKDTSSLIEGSIAKSNQGKQKVDELAKVLRGITEESEKMKMLVDEVNLGSEEQARGLTQIAKAVAQMEQVTQKTAATAEESAAAAEELTAQSEAMQHITERMVDLVGDVG